jgi:hypothetical protein
MAKKNTTLNDLTRFLQTENKEENSLIKEEDFFQKDPLSLVVVDADGIISTSKVENSVSEKFIDSKALQKTSYEEVHEQIKTLALDNNISVQQVITNLYLRTVTPITVTNMMDWTTNMQKNYVQFWADLQKSWKL